MLLHFVGIYKINHQMPWEFRLQLKAKGECFYKYGLLEQWKLQQVRQLSLPVDYIVHREEDRGRRGDFKLGRFKTQPV